LVKRERNFIIAVSGYASIPSLSSNDAGRAKCN
jgi:hypothetical protein